MLKIYDYYKENIKNNVLTGIGTASFAFMLVDDPNEKVAKFEKSAFTIINFDWDT